MPVLYSVLKLIYILVQSIPVLEPFIIRHNIFFLCILSLIIIFLFADSIFKLAIISPYYKKIFINKIKLPGTEATLKDSILFKILYKNKHVLKLRDLYKWANLPIPFEMFMLGGLMLILAAFLLSYILLGIFFSLIIILVFGAVFFIVIKVLAQKNIEKISIQLPFVLDTMVGALKAGYSLPQSFKFTAKEIEPPLKYLFEEAVSELSYNISIEQVFYNMQTRTENQELTLVLDALILQNRMGGNINLMLSKMSDWVRKKNKLNKDIKVFTSQGRLSGIFIMALWPISFAIFYYLNPTYISIMFESSIGYFLLVISVILEIIGFAMIWKIVKIKI